MKQIHKTNVLLTVLGFNLICLNLKSEINNTVVDLDDSGRARDATESPLFSRLPAHEVMP